MSDCTIQRRMRGMLVIMYWKEYGKKAPRLNVVQIPYLFCEKR